MDLFRVAFGSEGGHRRSNRSNWDFDWIGANAACVNGNVQRYGYDEAVAAAALTN